MDGEEIGVEARIKEAKENITKSGIKLTSTCSIDFIAKIYVSKLGFLGNRKIVKKIPEGLLLKEFIEHYNVTVNDEGLEKIEKI